MTKVKMALNVPHHLGCVGTEIEIESDDEAHEVLVELLAASIKTLEELLSLTEQGSDAIDSTHQT
jgi:hypothetical protein